MSSKAGVHALARGCLGQEEKGEGGRGQIMEVVWRDGISPDTCGKLLKAPR